MVKPFASSADLADKTETLEVLAPGVYALTAEGDPNVGAVEGETSSSRSRLGRLRSWPDVGSTSCASTPTSR